MPRGVLWGVLRSLKTLSDEEIIEVLEEESANREVTKSLANVLLNAVQVGSVYLTKRNLEELKAEQKRIEKFFTTESLETRRRIFLRNPNLVRAIAGVCLLSVK